MFLLRGLTDGAKSAIRYSFLSVSTVNDNEMRGKKDIKSILM